MKTTTRIIEIQAYTDEDGKPVCQFECIIRKPEPCEGCGRQWSDRQDGPLWTVRIPGGGVKRVHLPPLPDKISWVVNFKDGRAKRYSFPASEVLSVG